MPKILSRFLLLSCIFSMITGACSGKYSHQGYAISPEKKNTLTWQKESQSSFLKKMGTPQYVHTSKNNEEFWMYYGSILHQHTVFPYKEIKRDIIILYFDASKNLTDFRFLSLEDQKEVQLSKKQTPNPPELESSAIYDIFKGLGGTR